MSSIIDLDYTKAILLKLLNTPSPTGNTDKAIELVEAEFNKLGLKSQRTVKGALLTTFPGKTAQPARAITAHVDTLGGMVKEIKYNGRLIISSLGGYYPGSIVGEYCIVETDKGEQFTGTVLLNKQSVHIHSRDELHLATKNLSMLEVRLDAYTKSKLQTEALGIQVGDFISWEPRAQITNTGFIKSRHLDDKASVAIMLATAQAMKKHNIIPSHTTYFFTTTYEEVGHGGSAGIPDNVEELLAIDIGVLGEGQAGDEFSVSICPKDGGGPYDLKMRRQLTSLAKAAEIPYKLDIFVNYSSDGTAAWRAGAEMRVCLIGPGVDSTHAYERTHQDSLFNTTQLVLEYLKAS